MAAKFVLSLACSVAFTAAAHAQGLTKPWQNTTALTPEDRAIIQSTAESEIHGKPTGTVVNWTNPASGHSGTVRLLSKSARQGMPCERIEYRIMEPRSARYVFTSCRLSDGSWKLAG
jgi:surface antigen